MHTYWLTPPMSATAMVVLGLEPRAENAIQICYMVVRDLLPPSTHFSRKQEQELSIKPRHLDVGYGLPNQHPNC